jgi:presenilin-like A22 family membrane protease
MFLLTQIIGIAVVNRYSPETETIMTENGTLANITTYNLPYGTNPPPDIVPGISLITIAVAIIFAVFLMLFLRLWFFIVVVLAIGITLNSVFFNIQGSSIIALIIALPLAFMKIFRRNLVFHNITELMIYPGIAAIFVPLLSIWTMVILLVLISAYDIYAVWHAGFMQKMAKYQIEKLKIFAGFFVPYVGKKERKKIAKLKKSKAKDKRIRVSLAILGGGDVVFPIILAGVVLMTLGLIQAFIISAGATIALATLFYFSQKGKFYPAMPFITAGCFIALGIAYLI